MEGLLPLLLATGIGGGMLYASAKRKKDGFENLVQPSVARAMGPEHTEFVEKSQKKFNPIANLTSILNPPFKVTPDTSIEQSLLPAKVSGELEITPGKPGNYSILSESENHTANAIRRCEKVREINCDAFNDPNFANNCGICHEGGKDSSNSPMFGGLYISLNDKLNAEDTAKQMDSRRPHYKPSVGSCASGRFTVTKQQCERMKNQIECEKKQNFDVEGCSQCYQNEKFVYIDPDAIKDQPTLVLVGSGTLKFTKVGGEKKVVELKEAPQTLEIPDFKEGDIVQLEVTPETASIAGYLTGQTVSGIFTIDIIRLIQSDMISGQMPRMSGFVSINGESFTVIRPARGKSSMLLSLQNVFTFVNIAEPEASECSASPYITQNSSAEYLNSGPCFNKDQSPGKYSLECLQGIFTNSGCDITGDGYPSDDAKAKALMTSDNGVFLNLKDITQNVYIASQESYSGRRDGEKLTIPKWDEVSKYCTGKRILSPCDGDDKINGPLSADCINYIWRNQGAYDTNPGSIGPTYTNKLDTSSLEKNNRRFCTSSGTLAPVNQRGEYNEKAIAEATKKGGVDSVKKFYNDIHYRANDNSLSDDARKTAIQQCYGVDLVPPPSFTIGKDVDELISCQEKQIIELVNGPTKFKTYGVVSIRQNWILSFTLKPTGLNPNWASIVQISGDNNDFSISSRVPGIFFWPNSTRLQVSMLTGYQGWWSINTNGLPLNVDTNVTITMHNGTLKVKLTGGVNQEIEDKYPAKQYIGPGTVYSPTPWVPSFIGELKNVNYCSYDGIQSVLDYRPGRTKSSLQIVNYPPFDWSTASKPVAVLGPYGMGPWGGWWADGFPDNGTAKWIWKTVSAQYDEPSWSSFMFFYRYNNLKFSTIVATITAAIDNTGTLYVNDNFIGNTSGNITSWKITLPPGENKITIVAANQGGPAGLIVICRDESNAVVFVSDNKWTTN